MLSRGDISRRLLDENYNELNCENTQEHINDKPYLLQEVIRGRTHKSKKEAINCLFDIGIHPSNDESNGDTPLHIAIYGNVDKDVLEALLYSKHPENFHDHACLCGLEVIKKKNKRGQLPKELENITSESLQILNEAGR